MAEKAGASHDLVPVRKIMPEQAPGQGAILLMKDGSFRMIVKSGAVNFDMKNPYERQGLTHAFGALVNSLEVDFPLEIVSRSKTINVEDYTSQFTPRLQNDKTPEAVKRLIMSHVDHFQKQVRTSKIMQRELLLVVPWKGVRGPITKGAGDEIPFAALFKGLGRKVEKAQVNYKPTDLEITTAKQQLDIRSSQVVARLQQMGVWALRLDQDEVRRLLYSLYHPSLSDRQRDPGFDSEGLLPSGFSSPSVKPGFS